VFALTVLGPISTANLGRVYPHEHLLTGPPDGLREADPDLVLDDPAEVGAELELFAQAGGGTIVEVTTPDYGRDPAGLAALSRLTHVHLIAATGFNKALYSANLLRGTEIEALTDRFIGEILEGLGDADRPVRCGVIKVGTSLNEVKPTEEVVLRAAARAHLATGCPITTHTERGTLPERQLDIFEEEGVPASSVTVGHLDFCPDLDVVRRVAARGAYIEFDQIPKPKYALESEVIRRIIVLAGEGLSDHLLVSGDFSRKSYFEHWTGGPGLAYLLGPFQQHLAAGLREAGLDAEAIIEQLFTANPRRALAFRGPGTARTATALGWLG
jgi:5-phospho-D-xylono-1,4-lactonase